MKKLQCFITVLLVAVSTQAGSYEQNFNSVANGSANLVDGSVISDSGTGLAQVYNNGSWQALRLTQDGSSDNSMVGNYLLPDLDAGTAISGFTATFDVLIKNDYNSAADGFSFNFGGIDAMPTSGEVENGIYSSSAGPMLSIGWDTYAADGDGHYIWVYLNGSKIAGSGIYPTVSSTLDASFQAVSIVWDETGLDLMYGGNAIFTDVDVSGFVPLSGSQFAFSARTGGENQDVFIDNVSVQTIPEPVGVSLVCVVVSIAWFIRRRFVE